ncbi:octaprenyl-diphosphate synthase [Arenicella xantha]|uniref:Octaprenyl diphosphate synthase n=1 Tax=Arenicella xantha TaxID=644221 RepID=A0A395JID3_9GAMM|nr:polyprenyl synthetase family protein [Arenicella xantha]RBP49836.1 octaprenyl-diphosphate synthase [Arenicella xantha]
MTLKRSPISDIASPSIDIKVIIDLVKDDMALVNRTIIDNLNSEVALINQLGAYIIQAGGKRLRPVSLLLAAKASNPELTTTTAEQTLLAAIVEFIHTATLLHDDVVDESALRRGRETANELFGNAASVLVGDYLYSRAFQMMVEVGSMRVMEILSRTTNQIAEGEVMQLINCGSADTTEAQYMETIQSKTAILFEAATQLGAVITHQSRPVEEAMAAYGLHLGTAFQLMDDIMDYTANAEAMGKNVGDDLAEGKPTLPLINAIERSTGNDRKLLVEAITNASRENLDAVLAIIERTGSLAYTARVAREQADLAQTALKILPESPHKTALIDLAEFSVNRAF